MTKIRANLPHKMKWGHALASVYYFVKGCVDFKHLGSRHTSGYVINDKNRMNNAFVGSKIALF